VIQQLNISSATDGVGHSEPVDRLTLENPAAHKKAAEKALIPLPPTGFASVFCANPDVVQTSLQPRRAVGLCRRSAISQNAKFCREMQCGCTATLTARKEGIKLECPVSLGGKF